MGKKDEKNKKKTGPFSERPDPGAFQQQNLRAWQPLLTPKWVIGIFLVVGLIFIPIGIVVLVASNSVVEYEKEYEDKSGQASTTTSVTININENMDQPVYMYYKLTNYYQSHRRYVKSRSDSQLRGDLKSSSSSCDPLQRWPKDGKILYPCGLISNSFFTDTFDIKKGGVAVQKTDKGIAWSSDIDEKFKKVNDLDLNQYTRTNTRDITLPYPDDEHFIVWMRTAGLPTFKKLKYIIQEDLKKGDVITFEIDSNYPVKSFDGTKSVVLSTTSWLGGKNDFLGQLYVVVGVVCWVLAILFFIKQKISPRELGDMKYFNLAKVGPKEQGDADE